MFDRVWITRSLFRTSQRLKTAIDIETGFFRVLGLSTDGRSVNPVSGLDCNAFKLYVLRPVGAIARSLFDRFLSDNLNVATACCTNMESAVLPACDRPLFP
ncbi:hypothetical protein [Microcoleus sp. CZ3-B2]|uniref:hypothetical protein n=1 Tax=Microcoleus sp. CZ3-B2 TaxID=2818731 RepID=UPI002FD73EA9